MPVAVALAVVEVPVFLSSVQGVDEAEAGEPVLVEVADAAEAVLLVALAVVD